MSEELPLQVECYAGHRADEEPRRFTMGGRQVDVLAILDRWHAPDHRYFKVRASDGGIYLLRHDLREDRWKLILYNSGQHDENRLSST